MELSTEELDTLLCSVNTRLNIFLGKIKIYESKGIDKEELLRQIDLLEKMRSRLYVALGID